MQDLETAEPIDEQLVGSRLVLQCRNVQPHVHAPLRGREPRVAHEPHGAADALDEVLCRGRHVRENELAHAVKGDALARFEGWAWCTAYVNVRMRFRPGLGLVTTGTTAPQLRR